MSGHDGRRMRMLSLTPLFALLAGCASNTGPIIALPPAAETDLRLVQEVISEEMHLGLSKIAPDKTLAALGVDNLALAELTLELEQRIGRPISDRAYTQAVGTSNAEKLPERLTVERLAQVVTAARAVPISPPK